MPNNIPAEQNRPESLMLLRASSCAYDDARSIGTCQLVLSLSSALGGPILAALVPAAKAWTGLYGAVALLLDLIFFEPAAKAKQETGAKIQEMFDTRLYGLPWNKAKAGPEPDHETVVELARRHEQKHPSTKMIEDWYPVDAGKLPVEYGRLVCQRANMRWDSSLRKNFCLFYLILLVGMWIVGTGFALAMRYTLEDFVLSVVVPLLPASVQLWRERSKHADSAKDSERAKDYLHGLWESAVKNNLTAEELAHQARLLQDELYDRRKRSPVMPELWYSRKREDYELQMKQASEKMVNEVLQKLAPAAVQATAPAAPTAP